MNLNTLSNMYGNDSGYYICGEFHTGLTVSGLMEIYLKDLEKRVTPGSLHTIKRLVYRHIVPILGECEIDYLTDADIEEFLKEKRRNGRLDGEGGLSEKMVRDISYTIGLAFDLVRWDAPESTEFVDAPHLKPLSEILTLEQADMLTHYLTNNLSRYNAGFLLCLCSGIKLSEVCSLKDSDFDLANDLIHIQRTMQRATLGEKRVSSTFSTSDYPTDYYGNRYLKLPPSLSMRLWTLIRQTEDDVFFLSGKTSCSLTPRAYQIRFKKLLPEAGLPNDLNIHMLRNTFAWMWLLRENDLEGLTYAMGYKTPQITAMTYAPLLKNLRINLPDCVKFLSVSNMKP